MAPARRLRRLGTCLRSDICGGVACVEEREEAVVAAPDC
ncbi:hypothetical protein ERO13_D13G053150v2 [Gossypium hirsutum]|nr:hypothetical protein ERO13_D13G053150v2 [Gossypium hirsutum]